MSVPLSRSVDTRSSFTVPQWKELFHLTTTFLFCSGILALKRGDNPRIRKALSHHCVLKDIKKENKWLELELVTKL